MQYPVPVEEALEGYEREFGPVSPKAKEMAALLLKMANEAYQAGYEAAKKEK